jgi:hypothetical protein
MPVRTASRLTLVTGSIAVAALVLAGCAAGASGSGSASGSGAASLAEASAPSVEVASLEPAVGELSGGTTVTVSGSGFDGDTAVASVAFGTEPAAAVSVESDGALTVVAPASFNFVEGAVPVTITLEDGTVSTPADYTYEVSTPVDAQMAYAFKHWQEYNLAEWGVFEDNDCGNFVNQVMLQRGWEQSPEWFSDYATTGEYSFSWIRGNPMDAYYASRPDTTRYEFTDRSQLKIGDVVMLDWDPQNDNGVDHTQIVSKVTTNADGTISIAMVGHTLDSTYRDLDNAVTVEKPGGTAHFYSIA